MTPKKQISGTTPSRKPISIPGILLAAGILTGSILAGAVLLTLVYLLPVRPFSLAEKEALPSIEGWYPRALVQQTMLGDYFLSEYPDVMDYGTDYTMLSIALADTADGPLVSAMNSCNYARYWHGYVIFLRPLMYFFSITELRGLNMLIQLLLVLMISILLYRKKGWTGVLPFALIYGFMMPIALFQCFQYTTVTIIMLLFTAGILWEGKDPEKKTVFQHHYCLYFLTAGIMTSYFDFLTFPLLTLTVPLLLWILTEKEQSPALHYVGAVIKSALSWGTGYGIMWAGKWFLGSLILKRSVWNDAMESAQKRTATDGTWNGLIARADTFLANLRHFEYAPYLMIITFLFLAFFLTLISRKTLLTARTPAYALTGLSSIAWYFIFSEHTMGHNLFTYRMYVTVFATVLVLTCEWLTAVKEINRSVSGLMKRILLCLAGAAFAFFTVSSLRVEETVHNGTYEEYQAWYFTDVLSFSLEPAYDQITELGIGLQTESSEGIADIELYENGKKTLSLEKELKEWNAKSMQLIPVDYKFHNLENVELQIRIRDNDEPVYALLTQNDFPLQEEDIAILDGEPTEGQSLFWITYKHVPSSKKTDTLTFLTAFMVFSFLSLLVIWGVSTVMDRKKTDHM